MRGHVAIITKPDPPFPVRDVVMVPGLLPIFLHGCEIKSGSGLGTRLPGNGVQERLTRFLFDYRITPHTTTGVPLCEMLMNRRLRSHLDLFYPDVSGKVESRQAKQKELRDQRSLRQFTENDQVYVQDFTTKVTGPLSYMIELQDGMIVRRHVDHVRKRENSIGLFHLLRIHPHRRVLIMS